MIMFHAGVVGCVALMLSKDGFENFSAAEKKKKTFELWNLQNPFLRHPRFIKAHLFFQPHRFCLVMDL